MQDQINNENNVASEKMSEGTVFQEKDSKVGPIIGSIIIILIILFGGVYFWSQQVEEQKLENQMMDESQNHNDNISAEADINKIEVDLSSLNLDQIDKELDELDQELGL